MRSARAQDWRRRISEKIYALRLDLLVFKRVIGIGSGEVPFKGAITALCGGNGVGKTTLLRAVLGALDPSNANPLIRRMLDSELEASLTVDGEAQKRASRFQSDVEPIIDGSDSPPITRIDPGAESARLISLFSETPNLDELLEPLAPAESDRDELAALSYLVGREYSSCKTYEIEEYNNQPTFPYFVVESWGATYGSEHMGLGELALFLMYWQLKRIGAGSVLLLEEPETHISPQSQHALLDIIAKFSTQKSLWVILTTHSPGILANIPLKHIRLLSREGGAVTVNNSPTRSQLNSVLGIRQQFLGALLVEDRAAKEFARAWLNHNDPEILRWFDIVTTGSEAETIAALKFPKIDGWLSLIGIFDGDARARIKEDFRWPYAFLPGKQSPERTLREAAIGKAALIAQRFNHPVEEIAFILSEIEGRDPHDWFEEFYKRLGVSYEQLMSALFSVWVEKPENATESQDALAPLIKLLGLDEDGTD